MWLNLQGWLEARSARDGSYRRLVLPDPGGWTQIGYTARLSFPSRRDKSFLRRFLQENQDPFASPAAFISKFRNEIASPSASFALKQAFAEFHRQYFSGRRALADHRFWSFVQAVARNAEATHRPVQLLIDIARDQDETWTVSLDLSSPDHVDREYFDDLGSAAQKASSITGHELAAPLERGFVVFRQVGNARWRATPDISACRGRVMVGLSSFAMHRIATRLGALDQSGIWFLTREPVTVGKVEEAARHLGMQVERRDFIVPITVSDGVRTGGFWLGRPPFLPQIDADDAELSVCAEKDATGTVRCMETEKTPGIFRLAADGPVEGSYVISPAAVEGVTSPWSRRVRFVADALIHETSGFSAPANPVIEWSGPLLPAPVAQDFEPQWDEKHSPIDDLVEATYAGGRAGWNEMDIVALARTGLGERLNPWDVVRALQEATCLRPMLRTQWRGRVWALGTPALGVFSSRAKSVVVVDGCIGARTRGRFPSRRHSRWRHSVQETGCYRVGAVVVRLRKCGCGPVSREPPMAGAQ